VERARDAARAQGTSLNALIREFLETLAGHWRQEEIARDVVALFTENPGNSHGQTLRRDDIYDERLDRGAGKSRR
jgi:hypothetical protein